MEMKTTENKLATELNPTPASRLRGQRVVVLGGTAGIGLATALQAAQAGALPIVVSSRQARVDEALRQLGEGAEGYVADLTDEAQIHALFARIGAFDHLVYTAGESLLLAEVAGVDLAAVRRAFQLRYFGALTAVKYAQSFLRPGGSIVLTTGIASRRPGKGWAVGASICGAMDALTRALAVELAPIRVNAVSPGLIKTELWDSMSPADREAMYEGASQSLPVGHVGEAVDVAQTYVYLMQQPFSTGQILVVDGGAVLV
jgi:NAD(P)-dependent dehydrogenase (short-subunit alcohol dehydrogenase family)